VKGVPAPPLGDPELGMLRMLGLHLHHDPLLAATLARVLRHMALAAAARGADDAQAAAAHAQARCPRARPARARAQLRAAAICHGRPPSAPAALSCLQACRRRPEHWRARQAPAAKSRLQRAVPDGAAAPAVVAGSAALPASPMPGRRQAGPAPRRLARRAPRLRAGARTGPGAQAEELAVL